MKLFLVTDLETRKYEGRTQTSLALVEFLKKQGIEIVSTPDVADIIHFHSSGIFKSFQAARFKKKYKVPVIYTLYSISKTEPLNHFRNHISQNLYLRQRKTSFVLSYSSILPLKWRGFKLKNLDMVITPSYFVKKSLHHNAHVIRIGIDINKFKPLENKESRKNEKLKVAYFGHPSVYKGILDFAKASREFPECCESYIYLSDISEKIIKTLKRINSSLNLIGHTIDMPAAYHSADIIVLPYRSHLAGVANPLVLLEAMSCGKPVITTNFPYLNEMVKDAAILVKPYSPQQIVQAVNKLLDKKVRSILSQKARTVIENEFNQDLIFKEHLKVYHQLVHHEI